jgi:hypothetical protein
MADELKSLSLEQKQVMLTRLALENMARILTMPRPPKNDLSVEAQLIRDLILSVAEVAIANAREPIRTLH